MPDPAPEPPAHHGAVTIRDVARQAGLSLATVSLALRNSPRVKAATLARVQAAAKQVGYRPDPLVATLMSRLRGRQTLEGVNVIAILNIGSATTSPRSNEKPHGSYIGEIVAGMEERVHELGFKAEWFNALGPTMTPRRMGDILHHRGINAVIVPPLKQHTESVDLDWSRFAAVAIGWSLRDPVLHRVCPDQYAGMRIAVDSLVARGYRRIGLCLDEFTDQRVFRKWRAVMEWYNAKAGRELAVPVLVRPGIYREEFQTWFRKHSPHAVVGIAAEIPTWLAEMGVRVPEDVGFCHASWTDGQGRCAGIDQQPHIVGRAAVDMVVGQIHRNERGIPEHPTVLEVKPSWRDGPTVAVRSGPGGRLDPQRAVKPLAPG
jgi:LacI family transcriptional regulator